MLHRTPTYNIAIHKEKHDKDVYTVIIDTKLIAIFMERISILVLV